MGTVSVAAAPAVSLRKAFAVVEAAAALLATVDLDGEADDGLAEGLVASQQLLDRVAAQQLRVLERVEARQVHAADGAVSLSAWLRGRLRLDAGAASRRVSAARRLRDLPALTAALATGQVTLEHVVAVTEAMVPGRAGAVCEAEPILVDLALVAAPREVRRAVRRLADVVDPDGSDAPPWDDTAPDPRRELRLSVGVDGLWRLTGDLDPPCGEALATVLDAYDTPDSSDPSDPTDPSDSADAAGGERAAGRRSPAQRRHDAFDTALRRLLDIGAAPVRQGVKPHIVAMVDIATLIGAAAPRPPRLQFAGEVTLGCVLRLVEQAKLTAVATLGPWRAVSVGRAQRSLPAWLRPAMAAQHSHCRGPDCDRPFAWTQAHHLTAWADGGDTDLNAMIPLCQAHHSLVTTGTWQVTMNPDTGDCAWTGPDGRTRRTHPPPLM